MFKHQKMAADASKLTEREILTTRSPDLKNYIIVLKVIVEKK